MTATRRQRFVHRQVAWMLATLLTLILFDTLSFELFFSVSLIGFLILVELSAPITVTPRWRRRLVWVVRLGLVLFGYVVVRGILAAIPPGLF